MTSSTDIYIRNLKMELCHLYLETNLPRETCKYFGFVKPHFIQLWLFLSVWELKQTYVCFLPMFIILCIFTHSNSTICPFFTNFKLFWWLYHDIFVVYCAYILNLSLCNNSSEFLYLQNKLACFIELSPFFQKQQKLNLRSRETCIASNCIKKFE